MKKKVSRAYSWIISAGVGLTPALAMADAPNKAQCGDAYEQAQYLRREHKLQAAHEKLLVCIQSDCPSYMSTDCAQWLREVEGQQPSVVFAVRDAAGTDVTSVRVSSDGDLLTKRLSGESYAVDPGEHTFTFEFDEGEKITRKVLLRVGEKNRTIEVVQGGAEAPEQPVAHRRSLTPVWIAGGVGLAAFGTAAVFGFMAKNRFDELDQKRCAPRCDPSLGVDSLRTNALVTDIAAGVGVASLVVGGVFLISYLTEKPARESAPPPAAWRVTPVAGRSSGGVALSAQW